MKNSFLILVLIFLSSDLAFSQAPTYKLTAKNFTLGSINYPNDALYFDVYLEHTGGGNFELAGQHFYLSFNRNVFTPGTTFPPTLNGGTSANADTSQISLKIVGSDLPTNMLPRNNSLWTATSPTADIMRGAINTFPGAGFGIDIPVGFPGTKICRYRLWNKQGTFSNEQLNVAWRNPPVVAFSSKVFAYVGTTNTDITTPSTHFIEYINNPLGTPINLISPSNNSINVYQNPTFIWSKYQNTLSYKLQISDDSNFFSTVFLDTTLTDTFKTVIGLNTNTTYFWKVGRKDSMSVYTYSAAWKFTTAPGISLSIKFIPEGLYNLAFNILNRKDSLKIYLRNSSPPYLIVDSAVNKIDSLNFTSNYSFRFAPTGTYYIVAKHFNSIETWSKSGGQYLKIDSAVNYDFTTAASQAYGNNLKLAGNKYCAYSGDVTQDGIIDGDDLFRIDNGAYFFVSGNNLPTDLNGDNVVNGVDLLIADNNGQFITVLSPLQTGFLGFKFRNSKYIDP